MAAPAVVQFGTSNNETNPFGIQTLAFPSANVAENMLVAVGWGQLAHLPSVVVSDTQRNRWGATPDYVIPVLTSNFRMFIFLLHNCKAGANTVTMTMDGFGAFSAITEVNGNPTLDQFALGGLLSADGSGVVTSPTVTTTKTSELILVYFNSTAGGNFSVIAPLSSLISPDLGGLQTAVGAVSEPSIGTYSGSAQTDYADVGGIGAIILSFYSPDLNLGSPSPHSPAAHIGTDRPTGIYPPCTELIGRNHV